MANAAFQTRRVLRRLARERQRFARTVASAVSSIDPTIAILGKLDHQLPPPLGLCVYRQRNAIWVEQMVRQFEELDGELRLWALDESDPDLARFTHGVGPGGRLPLVNRLLATSRPLGHVVVFDDDVVFARGDLRQLLGLTEQYGLDLAQPAHGRGSTHSFDFSRRRPFTIVRETTFVEVGPLVVVSPAGGDRFLPFPEIGLMGWGTEALWYDQYLDGARIGIVDGVEIRHLGRIAVGYSAVAVAEGERGLSMVRERGYDSWEALQRSVRTYRAWNRR